MFVDLLFAFLVAVILTSLLVIGFGWRYPGRQGAGVAAIFLFLVFFFMVWALAAWTAPFGPPLWGSYWLPFVVIGVLLALLILAISAPTRLPRDEVEEQAVVSSAVLVTFGTFFWVLLLGALISIIIGYV